MEPRDFVYWLQGFIELNGGKEPTPEQWQMIKDHLGTVFLKVTPTYPNPTWPWVNPNPMPFEVTCGTKPNLIC